MRCYSACGICDFITVQFIDMRYDEPTQFREACYEFREKAAQSRGGPVSLCGLRLLCRGVAQVRQEKCVGCGKCARECPASVIKIREVEA